MRGKALRIKRRQKTEIIEKSNLSRWELSKAIYKDRKKAKNIEYSKN